jgi:hypothetical protein
MVFFFLLILDSQFNSKIIFMNKIKLFSTVFMSLAMAGVSKAQFDYIKPADMDEIHNRTLIVIVEKPSDEVIQKLNKKKKADGVTMYPKAIDDFNKNFAAAIAQYWKVTEGEIEYKTMDEVNDITDKKNYTILFCRTATQADLSKSYLDANGLLWWPDFKEVSHDRDFSSKMTVMGVVLLDRDSKTPVYQFPIPDLFPSKEDLMYAVNATNTYITYRVNHRKDNPKKLDEQMIQENQPALKDKTLLLCRDWMDKRLTKEEIDKYYPFPYMIAGRDTIDKAIDSTDNRYAVAFVTPNDLVASATGGITYAEYAYNIEDGTFLACSGVQDMPSANPAANNSATAAKPMITKKTLQDFCMYIKDEDSDKGGKKKGKK